MWTKALRPGFRGLGSKLLITSDRVNCLYGADHNGYYDENYVTHDAPVFRRKRPRVIHKEVIPDKQQAPVWGFDSCFALVTDFNQSLNGYILVEQKFGSTKYIQNELRGFLVREFGSCCVRSSGKLALLSPFIPVMKCSVTAATTVWLALIRCESSTQNSIQNVACFIVCDLLAPRIIIKKPRCVHLQMFWPTFQFGNS